jgi:hypothetical protein
MYMHHLLEEEAHRSDLLPWHKPRMHCLCWGLFLNSPQNTGFKVTFTHWRWWWTFEDTHVAVHWLMGLIGFVHLFFRG